MISLRSLFGSVRQRTWLLLLALAVFVPAVRAQIIVVPPDPGQPPAFTVTNVFRFEATNYFAQEDSIQALLTIVREGSLTNLDLISVDYIMFDGTAVSGTHYFRQPGSAIFLPGEDRVQIAVPLIDNFSAGGNVFFTVMLRNPVSGTATAAVIGEPSSATVTIIDDESTVSGNPAGTVEIAPGNGGGIIYVTRQEWQTNRIDGYNEANFSPYGPGGAEFTIVRRGGARGRILVDWQTTTNVNPIAQGTVIFDFFGGLLTFGGVAEPGVDFIPASGTVEMFDYQMSTNIVIRIPADIQVEEWRSPLVNTNQFFFGGAPPTTFGVQITGVRSGEDPAMGLNPEIGPESLRRIALVDCRAGFAFTRRNWVVSEGQRFVRIRVRRSIVPPPGNPLDGVHVHYAVNPVRIVVDEGGDHQDNTFYLRAGSEYTTPFIDYEPPGSPVWEETMAREREAGRPQAQDDGAPSLTWGQNEVTDRYIVIPLFDDDGAEFNEDMEVVLYKHDAETDGYLNGYSSVCKITIVDNDQPAGASAVDFNPNDDPLTDPPYMTNPGANGTVQAVVAQPDGKVILGGDFTAVNTERREGIARLNFDGSTDRSFNPGSGVSGVVETLAVQLDGKILLGGSFDAVDGIPNFNIARLHTNGAVDRSFNARLGPNGAVRSIAVQSDGRILIGGEFTRVNGTNYNFLARLNADGGLDTSFQTGIGPDGPVNSIALTAGHLDVERDAAGGPEEDRFPIETGSSRGTIVVNYDFLQAPDLMRIYYGDVLIFDSGVISSNGTFTVPYPPAGVPANSTQLQIVMNEGGSDQPSTIWYWNAVVFPVVDERPVIGGEFTEYNRVPRNFIARINLDGSLDDTFNPGTGADDAVYAVAKQGNKVIMAGDFTSVDLRPRRGVARLNEDGTLDTTFDPGSGFDNTVFTVQIQPNGRPVLGGAFRSFNQTRRIGLARLNLDGSLDTTFMDTAKNQFAGIPNPLSFDNPLSQENFIRSLAPYRLTNLTVFTNEVINTNDNTTNFVAVFQTNVTDHIFIGGSFSRVGGGVNRWDIRPRANIARIVGGQTPGPGNIAFLRDNYSVDENAGRTYITLTRTNGSLAPISAIFTAAQPSASGPGIAADGIDFLSTNRPPIWIRSHNIDREYSAAFMGPNYDSFSTNRQRTDLTVYPFLSKPPIRRSDYVDDDIFVTVLDDEIIEPDERVQLTLSAPDEGRLLLGGEPIPVGTALGKAQATLTIADNDINPGTLGFASAEYFVNENDGTGNAVINVTRVGGSAGTVRVDAFTRPGTAGPADYNNINERTPRTLTFAPGQTNASFTVRIQEDSLAELEETVFLYLTNATGFPANTPLAQRLDPARSLSTLFIVDDDFSEGRLSFTAATYTAVENENEIVVTVRRSGGNRGDVSVTYRTTDGTARAGEDYVAQQGTLKWTHGDSSEKTFVIPLLNDDTVESEETINLVLSDPTIPGALGVQPTAVIRIQNDDAVGTFSFSQPVYTVDENGPYADIVVIRTDGISGSATVRFAATNLTAVGTTNFSVVRATNGLPDFVFPEASPANGSSNILRFVEGQTSASFRIPLIDDPIVEGGKEIILSLFDATGGARLGLTNALLSIVDDELNNSPAGQRDVTFQARGADDYVYALALQPDGRILMGGDFGYVNDIVRHRLARLNQDGTLDGTYDPAAGPNDSVRALELQGDSRLFVGGLFNRYADSPRNRLVRLNIDSKIDPTFDPGAGADNPIFDTALQSDGKLVIVGSFSTYRGVDRRNIARVSTNGVLDTSFNVGTGADGTIWTVALQRDGKILIGGDFARFNGVPRNRIARLNRDGSVDTSFGTADGGANASVRSIVVQSDGNILVGGFFTTMNGRPYNRVARLRGPGAQAGQIDETFTLGFASDSERATNGADRAVNVIAVQIDGKILVGGDFSTFNGRTRNRITRLNSDGSLDPTINFGFGANGPISDILIQPDRRIILAGGFTEYDGAPAQHIVRIHGGALAGSGSLTFSSPVFEARETEANALVSIRRVGGTTGAISVDFVTTATDTAVPGEDYVMVTNRVVFPESETFRTVLIPLRRNTNVFENRFVTAILTNATGANLGTQPNARITILNTDSRVEFSATDYSILEDFITGGVSVTLRRVGSTNGVVTVDVLTHDLSPAAGWASAVQDYGAVASTITFDPGQNSRTFSIPIFDDNLVEGNERFEVILTNATGGAVLSSALSTATVTIVENDFSAGQVEFISSTYLGTEGSRQVVVRLRRVGGTTGVISVEWATARDDGGENPAETPTDYRASSGIASFSDGEELQQFTIELVDDSEVEGNQTFAINLFNPRGGTSIRGPSSAIGMIVDDDLSSGSLDSEFDPGAGANGDIRVVKLLPDGDILIGGDFTIYDGVNRLRIARLNPDASLETEFDPGVGANGTVADIEFYSGERLVLGGNFNTYQNQFLNRVARIESNGVVDLSFQLPLGVDAEVTDLVVQPDGKVVIGGMFGLASAAGRAHIARLNSDSTVDLSFNPGAGTDGNVHAVALQPDGRILIGGSFSVVNGTSRRGIARLNANGSVDSTFNTGGAGALNGPVHDILLLEDGKILIVGGFDNFNGANRARAALLNANGTLDTSFDPGVGPNRAVYAVARQPDGKYIIVGDFTTVGGLSRSRIARLNVDGSHDTTFQPGSGANSLITSVAIQPEDGRILIAGRFTEFDNVARNRIARLNNDRAFVTPRDVVFQPVIRSGGNLQFSFSSQTGFTYRLESTSSLDGAWTTVASQAATGSMSTFEIIPSERYQFFRIVRE